MLKVFRAQDFVRLAPLSEAGMLTLVDDLEAAAKTSPKVPSDVLGALARLATGAESLKHAMAVRERSGSRADPRARAADRAIDDAWSALQSWLLGWTLLPPRAHPKIEEARALYATLFPKGLQFLTLDFKDEWKESQARLDVIADRGLDSVVDALGGGAFLATLARAHRAYTEALQITPAGEESLEPDAQVQDALAATHFALREYVARVAATLRRREPETLVRAAALLAPLSERELAPATDDLDDATEVG